MPVAPLRRLALALVVSTCASVVASAQAPTPQAVVDDLLAADRAFSSAASRTDVVSGLMPLFADEGVMIAPTGLVTGVAAIRQALAANPDNATGRVSWTPVRAGISADAQQGFSFGYMTLTRADGTAQPLKYLAYWVKRNGTWKVAAYKRARAGLEGVQEPEHMAPSLPAALVAATADAAAMRAHEQSLTAAERAFSDEAGKVGLGAAFVTFGLPDAINLGRADARGMVVGNRAIGALVDSPATLTWGADRVIVASSGDLGVSIGRIVRPAVQGKPEVEVPFFTVWRRASPSAPWRYIAE